MGLQRYSVIEREDLPTTMEKSKYGGWVDAGEAEDEIKRGVDRVRILKQALALHHSMVLGGEQPSETSELAFRTAMDL